MSRANALPPEGYVVGNAVYYYIKSGFIKEAAVSNQDHFILYTSVPASNLLSI